MRPVTGGSILEVANVGLINGQTIMNVWHYRWDGAPSVAVDGDLITNVLRPVLQGGPLPGLLDGLKAMCNEICAWQYIRYQWITPIRYAPIQNPIDSGNGAAVDQALPQNVCGVVTLQSIFAGPGFTGRKHFGGLSVTDEATGLMTNEFRLSANLIMEVMIQEVPTPGVQASSTLVPVIFDRLNPENSVPWIAYHVQDTSRVIRRRTVGVGK